MSFMTSFFEPSPMEIRWFSGQAKPYRLKEGGNQVVAAYQCEEETLIEHPTCNNKVLKFEWMVWDLLKPPKPFDYVILPNLEFWRLYAPILL